MAVSPARSGMDRVPRQPNDGSGLRRVATSMAPVLALYLLYTLVRWAVAERGAVVGARHARELLRLEDWLDIDVELRLQRFALPHEWLITAANWYYAAGFLPVLIGCAILCAWRNPKTFQWWRHVFIISLLIALIGYAVFPLAPPRLLADRFGFVDTLLEYGPHYYGNESGSSIFNGGGSLPSLVNLYAAMPSMHVAWSFIAGALFGTAWRMRRLAVGFGALHAFFMAAAVVLTANHYVLDVLAGALVLGIAIGLTKSRLPVVGLNRQREAQA